MSREQEADQIQPVSHIRHNSAAPADSDLIAQLHRAHEQITALTERATRLELAVQGASDGIWDWDLQTDAVYFSPRWKSMLGYEDHELPNHLSTWRDRIHPDDRERSMEAIQAYLNGHTPFYELEHRLQHKDGTYRWILARGTAQRNPHGQPVRLAGSHSDITRRKEAEAALLRRDAILEAVRFASERFLDPAQSWEASIQQVLACFGETMSADRVYIFENHTGDNNTIMFSQRYEWVAPGIAPQIDNPAMQSLSYHEIGFDRWVHCLSHGQIVHGHVKDFPPSEQVVLAEQDIQSLLAVPITVEGDWWGFIGFDQCNEERIWLPTEMDALRAAVSTLGAALQRRQAETAMREQEMQLRMIFEQSPIGMVLYLGDDPLRINPAFERLLGYTHEEIRAQTGPDYTHPDDLPAHMQLQEELDAGLRDWYQINKRYIRKDGSVVWGRLTVAKAERAPDEPPYAIALVENIDEQMAVTAQLREAEEQYRSIFEATSDGLIINDPETGVVVEANPAAYRMHGYTREEFIGLHPSQHIHPDYHQLFHEYTETIKRGEHFHTEAVDTRKDGTTFLVEVDGQRFNYRGKPHMLGVVRDITERVQAYQLLEQRVDERTRELSTLLDVSHNLASMLEIEPLLSTILHQLKSVIDYSGAAVFTLEHHNELRLLEYQGSIPQEDLAFRWSLTQALHIRSVIEAQQPMSIADVWEDTPLARAFRETGISHLGAVPDDIRSWMGVPLVLRDQVIGVLSFDHSEADAFGPRQAALALAFANHAAVAIENARLYERAQSAAVLEERQRLARELHDSVSQALYGIALGSRTARTLLDRDPPRAAEPLDYVLSLAEAGLAEMRALIFELRPESLANEGLVAALQKQASSLRARHGIEAHLDLCSEPDVSLDIKEALYRIAQEALHNTVKHAQARHVEVHLSHEQHRLTLDLCDDGHGFDASGSFPGHLGLRSMRERVTRLGGTLTIHSTPEQGTRIRAQIPI